MQAVALALCLKGHERFNQPTSSNRPAMRGKGQDRLPEEGLRKGLLDQLCLPREVVCQAKWLLEKSGQQWLEQLAATCWHEAAWKEQRFLQNQSWDTEMERLWIFA